MSRPKNFFAPKEWYHCYSRGIDKRTVFEDTFDYQRFISLLYLENSSLTLHRSDLGNLSHHKLLTIPREETLISIGAYTLMPNHFHLFLYEKSVNGISTFMQKLGTAYTMYFNIKYERSGGLFTKPFRARHVSNDRYFQHVVDYIHLNHIDLSRRRLDNGKLDNRFITKVEAYPFSSFPDFTGVSRPSRTILGDEIFEIYQNKTTKQMLDNALSYAKEFSDSN